VFPNAKTAGNRVILQMCAEFRGPNTSNVIGPTKPSITASLCGVVKLMTRLTLPAWKPRRANHALTPSNVQTARANTKQTPPIVRSRNIGSTKNGMQKNMLRFETIENSQFFQL